MAWRLDQLLWWRCGGCEFVHGFLAFGLDLGGIWVAGFRFGGCDFFRWVGGFVLMGLMVVFGVC